MRQKFVHGDLVEFVRGDRDTFKKGAKALIIGSYDDQHGESDTGNEFQYTVMLLPSGEEVSWCEESRMKLIEHKGAHHVRQLKENKQDKDFEEDKAEMLKEGLVPDGTHRNTWKRL
jgi:hypothetical protein